MAEACCTCATLLSNVTPLYDKGTEKPVAQDRRLECCSRVICSTCIYNNPRFGTYCPFCQVSTRPSPLPQGLREPPAYSPPTNTSIYATLPPENDGLPTYSSLAPHEAFPPPEKKPSASQPAEDVLHFIDHSNDSVTSLSLRYKIPINALRRTNGLTSDHLLLARRTVLIPGEFYKGGVSLSPRPPEGEEEEARRSKVRRWMMRCKVSEYDIAVLYLKQSEYDLEEAVEAFQDDETWEKDHPIQSGVEGRGRRSDLGKRRFTGQGS